MTDVTVAIISFNAGGSICNLLDSLMNVGDPLFHTLLVDDASTDNTVEIVHRKYPQVEIAVNSANLGHSTACNRAIDLCRTRYLVFLDHDTVVDKDFLQPLLRTITEGPSSIAAVTSCIVDYKGRHRYRTDFHYLVSSIPQYERPKDMISRSQIAATTSVLIDLERIGDIRFDEVFFIYNNDLDFFYRMGLRGLAIAAAPDSMVEHLTGTTELSNRGGRSYSRKRAFYLTRNRLFFLYKNYQLQTLIVLAPMFILHEMASFSVYASKGFWEIFPQIALSFLEQLPNLRIKRRHIQQMRSVGDRFLISTGTYDMQEDVLRGKATLFLKRVADWLFITYFSLAKPLLSR